MATVCYLEYLKRKVFFFLNKNKKKISHAAAPVRKLEDTDSKRDVRHKALQGTAPSALLTVTCAERTRH